MRKKIWNTLCNAKFKEYYIGYKLESLQHLDRNLNIFLAITSSGSIAGWLIWDKLYIIWSVIIGLSQVVNIIKPFFPFSKYIKEFNVKLIQMENLNLDFEKLWYNIESNKITKKVMENKYFALKKELTETLRFSEDTVIKTSEKIKNKSNKRMKIFIKDIS